MDRNSNSSQTSTNQILKQKLVIALQKSFEAVSFDNSFNYSKACKNYGEVVSILESDLVSSNCSALELDKIASLSIVYSERIESIIGLHSFASPSTFVQISSNNPSSMLDWAFQEVDVDLTHDQLLEIPTALSERPYFLMRLLMDSMNHGTFIHEKLFIPRDLWYQTGAKFIAIETKLNSCETLLLWLMKLKELDLSDLNSLSKDIEEFCEQLVIIQNLLARKLNYVDEINTNGQPKTFMSTISKQVERMAANYQKDKVMDSTEYVKLLYKIFDIVQFLQSLRSYLSSLPSTTTVASLLTNLGKIDEFMHNVFLGFVFQDLRMLLKRYVKKNRADFV